MILRMKYTSRIERDRLQLKTLLDDTAQRIQNMRNLELVT
jgi:hypothetical protein